MPDDKAIEMVLMNQRYMQHFTSWVEDLKVKAQLFRKFSGWFSKEKFWSALP